MGQFIKKMLLLGIQQVTPILFEMGNNYIQQKIEIEKYEINQKSMDANLKLLSKIDAQILKREKFNIPALDLTKDELGRATWKKIHGDIAGLPKDANPDKVKKIMANTYEMIKEYPCMDCRDDGVKFADKLNWTNTESRSDAMLKSWELHNMVHKKMGKDLFSYQDFQNEYDL